MINPRRAEPSSIIYKFPDYDELKKALDALPNREVVQFNNFLRSANQATLGGFLSSSKDGLKNISGVRVLEIFRNHLNWPRPKRKIKTLSWSVRTLQAPQAFELFCRTNPETQAFAAESIADVKHSSMFSVCSVTSFLKLLEMTNFPLDSDGPMTIDNAVNYATLAREKLTREGTRQTILDLSDPSDEFVLQINLLIPSVTTGAGVFRWRREGYNLPMFEPFFLQIIMMLRAVYGETYVLDVAERSKEFTSLACPDDLLSLLSNWDDLKDYPINWIESIHDFKYWSSCADGN